MTNSGRSDRLLLTGLGAATVAGHLLYPAALWALARVRHAPAAPAVTDWPAVTAVVPAYREAGVIRDKVDDLRANAYPGKLDVLVVAEDPETAAAARCAGAMVIEPPGRLGKAQALNVGVAAATHEVVFLTDANNLLEPGSIARLVRYLAIEGVGAAAGEKVERDRGGEELYWRFESALKCWEWELGTTLGIVGEIVAVRRDAWRPVPPDISSDDLWLALDLAEQGLAVAYEPQALSLDPPVDGVGAQWERRTRILSGSLYVFWRKRHLFTDPANALLVFEMIGHKLWRSTLGPMANVALVLVAARHPRRPLHALVLAGHVAAGASLLARTRVRPLPGPLAAAAQVVYLQAVAFGGMLRFARRDRVLKWAKPAR